MEKKKESEINNYTKYVLGGLAIIAVLVVLAVFQRPSNELEVIYCDVGQGDGAIIRTPEDQKILIDGGPDDSVLACLGQTLPFYDRKINLVILSHPHADHITGLIDVLRRYQVQEVMGTGVLYTTNEYLEFLRQIQEKKIPFTIASAGVNKNFGKLQLEVFWPEKSLEKQNVDNLNNSSIVAKFTYDQISFLFTGDDEKDVQRSLIANQSLINSSRIVSNILKVPHHGSTNADYLPFLEKVTPKVAVISVGKNNKFGHPAPQTLKDLEKIGAKIYRTDQNGSIKISSDGKDYWVKSFK